MRLCGVEHSQDCKISDCKMGIGCLCSPTNYNVSANLHCDYEIIKTPQKGEYNPDNSPIRGVIFDMLYT